MIAEVAHLTRPPDGEVIVIMVVWNGLAFLAEGIASVRCQRIHHYSHRFPSIP